MKGKKHNGSHHGEHCKHEMERAPRARGGSAKDEDAKADPDTGWEAEDKSPEDVYEGKGSKVVEAARKRRCGGKVEGEKAKKRLDRKPRAKGGRVGAEKAPLSEAARVSQRPGGKMDSEQD